MDHWNNFCKLERTKPTTAMFDKIVLLATFAVSTLTLYFIMANSEQMRQYQADTKAALANLSGDIDRLYQRLEDQDIPQDILDEARTLSENAQALAGRTPEDDEETPGEDEPVAPDQA